MDDVFGWASELESPQWEALFGGDSMPTEDVDGSRKRWANVVKTIAAERNIVMSTGGVGAEGGRDSSNGDALDIHKLRSSLNAFQDKRSLRNKRRQNRYEAASLWQAAWRGFHLRRDTRRGLRAQKLRWRRIGSTRVQALWRGRRGRAAAAEQRRIMASTRIQMGWRSSHARLALRRRRRRRRYGEQDAACVAIQKTWRRWSSERASANRKLEAVYGEGRFESAMEMRRVVERDWAGVYRRLGHVGEDAGARVYRGQIASMKGVFEQLLVDRTDSKGDARINVHELLYGLRHNAGIAKFIPWPGRGTSGGGDGEERRGERDESDEREWSVMGEGAPQHPAVRDSESSPRGRSILASESAHREGTKRGNPVGSPGVNRSVRSPTKAPPSATFEEMLYEVEMRENLRRVTWGEFAAYFPNSQHATDCHTRDAALALTRPNNTDITTSDEGGGDSGGYSTSPLKVMMASGVEDHVGPVDGVLAMTAGIGAGNVGGLGRSGRNGRSVDAVKGLPGGMSGAGAGGGASSRRFAEEETKGAGYGTSGAHPTPFRFSPHRSLHGASSDSFASTPASPLRMEEGTTAAADPDTYVEEKKRTETESRRSRKA